MFSTQFAPAGPNYYSLINEKNSVPKNGKAMSAIVTTLIHLVYIPILQYSITVSHKDPNRKKN